MTELVKYESAKRALSEALVIDEVKNIRDVFIAMQAYARQANDKEMEVNASEFRFRAERRLGEMIIKQKETVGLNTGSAGNGRPILGGTESEPPKDTRPKLSDAGIDKKLSSHAQAQASIPEETFEAILAEHREKQKVISFQTMDNLTKNVHVSNNSGKNEWYTPQLYIDLAREIMGSIDCDPASSEKANENVKAIKYYSENENGLLQKWNGNVWMNPPYAQPLIADFSKKVIDKYVNGEIEQALILVNNATETVWGNVLLINADAVCFIKTRVKFLDKEGNPTGAPLQGQMLVYMGKNRKRFKEECQMKNIGVVLYHG